MKKIDSFKSIPVEGDSENISLRATEIHVERVPYVEKPSFRRNSMKDMSPGAIPPKMR